MKIGHTSSGNLLADRRFTYAQDMLSRDDYEAAADILRQTIDLVPDWAPLWFSLGETLLLLNDSKGAMHAFTRVSEIDPQDHLGANGRLALLFAARPNREQAKNSTKEEALSAAYVTALFDQYADRFDMHLTEALGYRGPAILLEALLQACEQEKRLPKFLAGADLGCGTGLMAVALRPHVKSLTGVDLSSEMIAQARKTGLYQSLRCEGILTYLADQQKHSLDLLMAADVLVYIGDLQPLMQQAARTLIRGGLFALTIQAHQDNGYRLGADMRYHHSAQYLREVSAAADLAVLSLEPCVTRKEAGVCVAGYVAVLGVGNNRR